MLVAKYADRLPLYRQQGIFERAGLALPTSTLAHWVGACGLQPQPLLKRYFGGGHLSIGNKWVENQIQPLAIGRNNLLFAGSLRAGKRAAAIMSRFTRRGSTAMKSTPI